MARTKPYIQKLESIWTERRTWCLTPYIVGFVSIHIWTARQVLKLLYLSTWKKKVCLFFLHSMCHLQNLCTVIFRLISSWEINCLLLCPVTNFLHQWICTISNYKDEKDEIPKTFPPLPQKNLIVKFDMEFADSDWIS